MPFSVSPRLSEADMSAVVKLAMLVIAQAADRYEAEAQESFQRSRDLINREGTPEEEDGDAYETGYAEGRHSARKDIAADLRRLRQALDETLA